MEDPRSPILKASIEDRVFGIWYGIIVHGGQNGAFRSKQKSVPSYNPKSSGPGGMERLVMMMKKRAAAAQNTTAMEVFSFGFFYIYY
mmetsp:Transcript_28989/g.47625  ORF Transcript_28989/g.47625 Transcript_28989/m.47625 type:complete len:87 (-) Transcript_28989:63-323(-)